MPTRRASVGSALSALAIFAIVLVFIVIAARRPAVVASYSAKVEVEFRAASALQTLRLYAEQLRAAQEGLWLDSPRASGDAYAQARRWFEEHLIHVAWANPAVARQIHLLYERYVRATLQARRTGSLHPPPLLARDYTQMEEFVFRKTMRAYDRAYAEQDRYYAFTHRTRESMLALSLVVAVLTLLLLALSQSYRARLQRSAQERIAFLAEAAMKDALTGLRNLRAFEEELPRAAALALRCNHVISLMLLDLDGFKEANDRFGHAAGDEVLKSASERLSGLREADGAYRLGGDEFAIVLPGTSGPGAEIVARRLLAPIAYDRAAITLSAGIAQLHPGEALTDWRERADIALYEAKRRGGDTAVLFESIDVQTRFVSAHAISRLRNLLAEGRMETAFQPIWDGSTGAIFAFEALARPPLEYGFAGPQEAFDTAQRVGRVVELDRLCLESALAAVRTNELRAQIFLNVTPATLEHPLFQVESIGALLAEHEIDPSRVVIEITERTIKDIDAVVRSAQALRELGMRIALDDVGTGSSGLSLLSTLTFDFVKIDRTLMLDGKSRKARAILAGIVSIAAAMDAVLIAEGIETPALLEFASTLHLTGQATSAGVGAFQGYLLGAPQILTPSRNVERLFNDRHVSEMARTRVPSCG